LAASVAASELAQHDLVAGDSVSDELRSSELSGVAPASIAVYIGLGPPVESYNSQGGSWPRQERVV